jgi:hypothetical protein
MTVLSYTAVTQSGRTFDIEFPLHPLTRSSAGVGDVVTALLDAMSRETNAGKGLSDGDLLQALTMTLALRAHMTGAVPEHMRKLVRELYDCAHAAVLAAAGAQAGHA